MADGAVVKANLIGPLIRAGRRLVSPAAPRVTGPQEQLEVAINNVACVHINRYSSLQSGVLYVIMSKLLFLRIF